MRALPGAMVPNDSCLLSHCCVCLQQTTAPPCHGCGYACLCSRCAAHAGSRRIHGDECTALARLARAASCDRPADTRSLRLLMRLLLWRWRSTHCADSEQYFGADGSYWGGGDVLGDEFEDCLTLAAPPDNELPESLAQSFMGAAQAARFFLDSHARAPHSLAASLMGAAHCNALTVYDDVSADAVAAGSSPPEVGLAVSSSAALLNHGCEPNATWRFDGDGCIVISTTRAVRRGEELLICYVDPRLPAHVRRSHLRECYFFECDCDACVRGLAQWSCTLCGAHNGAGEARCGRARCAGQRARHTMPLGKRGAAPWAPGPSGRSRCE